MRVRVRVPAGSGGADVRGLYRVHQFSKVEMFMACPGDAAASDALHAELLARQLRFCADLGLHVRVLDMPPHELGASGKGAHGGDKRA